MFQKPPFGLQEDMFRTLPKSDLWPDSPTCIPGQAREQAQGFRAVLPLPWKENGLVRAWRKIEGTMVFSGGASSKEPACEFRRHKRLSFDPWVGKIPWKMGATHSSILAWRIPWTEEPGGSITLQSGIQLKRLACTCAECAIGDWGGGGEEAGVCDRLCLKLLSAEIPLFQKHWISWHPLNRWIQSLPPYIQCQLP